MLGLKPIKMLPARERVAAALRKAIISRQITEGEVLTLHYTSQRGIPDSRKGRLDRSATEQRSNGTGNQ